MCFGGSPHTPDAPIIPPPAPAPDQNTQMSPQLNINTGGVMNHPGSIPSFRTDLTIPGQGSAYHNDLNIPA